MSKEVQSILFPGQGAQADGMGRKLAESSKDAMDLWKTAEKYCGHDLRGIYWDSQDTTLMAHTNTLQPAITVVNLALFLHLQKVLTPAAFAGHSLGEFSALAAAKVLSINDVLEAVALRGRLMQEADPEKIGTMYAILRLNSEQVEGLCKDAREKTGKLVRLANYNTPTQFAISGHRDAIEELVEHVRPMGGKAVPLSVSGAFHTSLMAEASTEFSKFLDNLDWNKAFAPIYCNTSAQPLVSAEEIHAQVRKQMVSSVLWTDTIVNQWNAGVNSWVEFGPQGVLSRMVKQIMGAQDFTTSNHTVSEEYKILHIPNMEAANNYSEQ